MACLVATIAPSAIAGPGPTATPAPTKLIVVRPVTSSGHPVPGFTVSAEPGGSVDCSFAEPSPAAVSPNIDVCSPSAEYAVACWKSFKVHRVYCLRDPQSHEVVQIPRRGAFAKTPVAKPAHRAPLAMILGDGDKCDLRSGGTGPILNGHPHLVATYYCASGGAVWALTSGAHLGVNESSNTWVVRTSPGGAHPLRAHRVAKAYFVGTKRLAASLQS